MGVGTVAAMTLLRRAYSVAAKLPPRNRRRRAPREPASATWAAMQRQPPASAGPDRRAAALDVCSSSRSGTAARSAGGRLHLLWTTPVYSVNAVDEGWADDALNERLAWLAAVSYKGFAAQQTQLECRLTEDVSWLNNAFFEWQQMQYHSQGGWPELYGSDEFARLVGMIDRGVGTMEAAGALPPTASWDALEPPLVWAALHHDGTSHEPHTHPDVLLSGTYYAHVAPGSAPLELYGRPGWGGLDATDSTATPVWQWQPRAGDLVLFRKYTKHSAVACGFSNVADRLLVFTAPWVEHGVPVSTCSIGAAGEGPTRTAFSFNLLGGTWDDTRSTAQRITTTAKS